jgi:hypothetical protein
METKETQMSDNLVSNVFFHVSIGMTLAAVE